MECPLTNLEIPSCPVTTCMWHSKKTKGKCLLNKNEVHEIDLAKSKNLTVNQGYKETARAKSAIISILFLDKYYAKAIKDKHRKYKSTTLRKTAKAALQESLLNKPCFSLRLSDFIWMLKEHNYEEFCDELEDSIKIPALHTLLGLNKKTVDNLQYLISKVEKRKEK